jgi:ribosomal-protein-serine acetyltransferase
VWFAGGREPLIADVRRQEAMIPAGSFILRPYQLADASALSAGVRESGATVGRWMSWAKPDFSEYDAVCWFEQCNQARAAGKAHEFGIFDADGRFVGGCGLNECSAANKMCNLGYWVRQSRQREGAAIAAVAALRDFGFGQLGFARIEIVVAEGNVASIRVAEKAGAQHECVAQCRLQVHGRPMSAHIFSFTREPAEQINAADSR